LFSLIFFLTAKLLAAPIKILYENSRVDLSTSGLMALSSFNILPETKSSCLKVLLFTVFIMLFSISSFSATPDEEIVLTFSHPAVGQFYISAVYSNNSVYLPAMELFNLLYINYEKGSGGKSLQGTWLTNDNKWEINTNTFRASSGNNNFALTADDFRVGELDLYLSPALFEKMFGLKFTINMSALNVSLQSDKTLPVEEKRKHEELRSQLQRQKESEESFPMLYPRKRMIAGGGMVDYNLGLYTDNNGISELYSLTGGMELLGGDIQGTVYGSAGYNNQPIKVSNASWRYAFAENPFLTSVRAGQVFTTGLINQRILGGSVSNDPIEPRKIYNPYSIDGNTIPDSEVELYVNNQLTDYARADELGYYRFSFSLTYGTVRINLRIYTPGGQIITEERQLQIPFTFLPKGIVSYNVQGGAMDDGLNEVTFDKHALHGDVAYGLTNTLTIKAGTDYFSYYSNPIYYGSFSARLFDQYLFNIDAAPNAYYRATATVTYASSRNLSLNYTKFDDDSLFNPMRAQQEIDASFYFPFKMFGLQSGARLGGENYMYKSNNITNYNFDLNTRVGRFNIRANYRDKLIASTEETSFGFGLVTGAVTYTFSRTPGVPVFVKGMFLRAQTQYDIHNKQMFMAGLQFSRTVFQKGRFNINIDRYIGTKSTFIQAGFILDLNSIRANSQYTSSGRRWAFQQTFNGSVGLDSRNTKLKALNREQVGRAAVSVIMFIDSNNNHKYDRGEEKIPARAIRLDESATIDMGKDSILRISQLQSYWKYNAEIVQSAIPNPTLAPASSYFSFIADPNRYKPIEIPLYRTSVIEGKVILKQEDIEEGLGGVRLFLKGTNKESEATLRTFSDGSYYSMNLIPGKYTIEADPTQLAFLSAISKPEKLEFEVKALAEGDYISNLDLVLLVEKPVKISDTTTKVAEKAKVPVIEKPVIRKDTTVLIVHEVTQETVTVSEDTYAIQLGAFRVKANADALRAKLEILLGRKVDVISEGGFFKVRINDIKERKEVDEYVDVLHRNGINELWIISLKAKQRVVLGQRVDTITKITETVVERPQQEVSNEMILQAGAFRLRSNAIELRDKLAHTFDENVIITYENGYYKVRVMGSPIMRATVIEEMNKLMPSGKLGLKDIWLLPIQTPAVEPVPVKMREPAPSKISGRKEIPVLNQFEAELVRAEVKTVAPITAGPKISLQVGAFIKKSEALRAQRKISKKFNREVEIVQRYEYYIIIIPGFKTRQETFRFYPELAGMGYTKVSLIEQK
jgi:cell division protein FtsN